MDIKDVVSVRLAGLDEEMLQYIENMLEEMSLGEQSDPQCLFDTIGPFLLDSEFADEDRAMAICKGISAELAGGAAGVGSVEDDTPALLQAPVRILQTGAGTDTKPQSDLRSDTCGTDVTAKRPAQGAGSGGAIAPRRKMKKLSAACERQLQEEARAQEALKQEMAAARMAAVLARRLTGRQAAVGVHLDRLTIPHPCGSGDIIADSSLSLSPNRIYGLIGKNGSGKSTLLRALASYKIPDIEHLSIFFVEQSVEGDESSAKEWVLGADVERTALIEEEAKLSQYLHAASDSELPPELKGVNIDVALAECYERMDAIRADSAEMRAVKVLSGLGFTEETMQTPTNLLSGGWTMRAALAAALYIQPDVLLLDEPTNHLDLDAIMWLEHWLQNKYHGTAVIVSHDHSFLSDICTDIVELKGKTSKRGGVLSQHSTDFESFQVSMAERRIAATRDREALAIKKEKLQNFVAKEGKKADHHTHQNQKKSKLKKLEDLGKQEQEIEGFEDEVELTITLPSPYSSFDPFTKLIRVENISFAWNDDSSSNLFKGVDFCINPNSRICICGKNGSGKTSLLDIICGDVPPSSGAVSWYQGSTLTRLQQHHYRGDQLDRDLSPLEHLRRLPFSDSTAIGIYDPGTRMEEQLHRSYLSNFGLFGPLALVPVKYLSGGQKMRIALSIALYNKPDVLVLDEPTNHLDGDTVFALCEALQIYTGAVIFVSHDETFVNNVLNREGRPEIDSAVHATKSAFSGMEGVPAGELWVLSNQKLQRFEGSFTNYKKKVAKGVHLI